MPKVSMGAILRRELPGRNRSNVMARVGQMTVPRTGGQAVGVEIG